MRILPALKPLSLEQRRMLIDTAQLWEAWTANERRLASYSGSLGWQTLRSGQYLV